MKSKPSFALAFLHKVHPRPEVASNAVMRVTDARLFNEDGSAKTPAELKEDQERREREYPRG